jgi:hypothetical protein
VLEGACLANLSPFQLLLPEGVCSRLGQRSLFGQQVLRVLQLLVVGLLLSLQLDLWRSRGCD